MKTLRCIATTILIAWSVLTWAAQGFVAASSEYYSYADNAALDVGAGDFTIAMFVKISTDITNGERWISKGNSTGGGCGGGVRYEVRGAIVAADESIRFTVDDDLDRDEVTWSEGADPTNNGVWRALIFERDVGTHLKIFEGATERASVATASQNIDNACSLVIAAGRNSGDTIADFADIEVAQLVLFKRLLTSQEKTDFANGACVTSFSTGPVAYMGMVFDGDEEVIPLTPTEGGSVDNTADPDGAFCLGIPVRRQLGED